MIDYLEGKKRYFWALMALSALGLIIPLSLHSLEVIEIDLGDSSGIVAIFALMSAWILFFVSFYIIMTVDAFSTRAFRRDRLTKRGTFTIWLILTVMLPVVIYSILNEWIFNLYMN